MTSISGLQSGNFTDIDVLYSIALNQDKGSNNQVIKSDGENSSWGDVSGLISFNKLSADGSTITIGGSTAGNYDTTVDKTIAVAKVPNALTKGTNINFNTGTTYDGSGAITISATDTDTTYQGSSTISINTGTTPDTINCLKVPSVLTAGSNVSMVVTADGSSASDFNGGEGITIIGTADTNTQLNLTEGNGITITNTGGVNRTIAVNSDGSTFSNNVGSGQAGVLKVPNNLTAGDGVSFFNTSDGGVETIFSGAEPITMNVLPPNVFDVSGAKRMTINLANFMTNDDSTFYNIISEDDGSSKIHGAIKPANAVVEMVGYFIIPNGFGATACRIDATDAGGSAVSRTLTFESFTTYGATGFTARGTGSTNSEQSFSSTHTGASDTLLLIRINTTSTSDHIRGGYIRLV